MTIPNPATSMRLARFAWPEGAPNGASHTPAQGAFAHVSYRSTSPHGEMW